MIAAETSKAPLKVLAICAFPVEAAATRFRLQQFVEPLKQRGIELYISPFLENRQFRKLYSGGGFVTMALAMSRPILKRLKESFTLRKYDVMVIQREAAIFGPGLFEWLYRRVGNIPVVLDLDDATYVKYVSPTYGRIGSALKFFGKTDNLIRRSDLVVCGNRFIAEHVTSLGGHTVVVPTIVDPETFKPRATPSENRTVVIGWIGTHSTFPFLETLFPVLTKLAADHTFSLKIVGSGRKNIKVEGVDVKCCGWDLDREVDDFRTLDIGLYPICPEGSANSEWIKGKSGFKAIQYMAVGVPFVMSPVGVCAEIGEPGRTHFNAENDEDWYNSLSTLIKDPTARAEMGATGRRYSVEHFNIREQADKLADVLRSVIRR